MLRNWKVLVAVLAGIVAVCFVPGCGGGSKYDLQPVAGTAEFEDVPVRKGSITFTPNVEKKNDGPSCVLQLIDGNFASGNGQGVIVGPHYVDVVVMVDAKDDPKAEVEEGETAINVSVQTRLRVEVDIEEGGNVELAFDLRRNDLLKE